MRSFRFSLEKVLTLREMETIQAREALAAAQTSATEASVLLSAARRAREAFVDRLEERRLGGMVAWEWAATSRQLEALSRAETASAAMLHQALEAVAVRRVELAHALRREEALAKLRERQWEEFQYAERLADQAATDEMAQLVRLARRGVG